MCSPSLPLCLLLLTSGLAWPSGTRATADEPDVATVLQSFRKDWPATRVPYRTEADTTTWKTYALSMRQLVALGAPAIPELIVACDDPNFQVRALAARVLGYLKAEKAVAALTKLLGDPQASVALLAADALGQIGTPAGLAAMREAKKSETRGDVLLHINKAIARNVPLEEDVVEQVMRIDRNSIDSAKVGALAPDFTLRQPDGTPWTLSDHRGKKTVVLVFIYGDG